MFDPDSKPRSELVDLADQYLAGELKAEEARAFESQLSIDRELRLALFEAAMLRSLIDLVGASDAPMGPFERASNPGERGDDWASADGLHPQDGEIESDEDVSLSEVWTSDGDDDDENLSDVRFRREVEHFAACVRAMALLRLNQGKIKSADDRTFVEDHLEVCADCAESGEDYLKVWAEHRARKRRRLRRIGVSVPILVSCVLLGVFAIVPDAFPPFSNRAGVTPQIADSSSLLPSIQFLPPSDLAVLERTDHRIPGILLRIRAEGSGALSAAIVELERHDPDLIARIRSSPLIQADLQGLYPESEQEPSHEVVFLLGCWRSTQIPILLRDEIVIALRSLRDAPSLPFFLSAAEVANDDRVALQGLNAWYSKTTSFSESEFARVRRIGQRAAERQWNATLDWYSNLLLNLDHPDLAELSLRILRGGVFIHSIPRPFPNSAYYLLKYCERHPDHPSAAELARLAFESPFSYGRMRILKALLQQQPDEKWVGSIFDLASDPEVKVRIEIGEFLRTAPRSERADEVLERLLSDSDASVRAAAREAERRRDPSPR